MALSTYSELKTAIANWLNRTDLTDEIANDFIKLCESDFNAKLRIRPVKKKYTFTMEPHDVFANKFVKGASGSFGVNRKIGDNDTLSFKANVLAIKPKDRGLRIKSPSQSVAYEKNIGKGTTVSAYASGDLKKKKVNQVGFRITKRF